MEGAGPWSPRSPCKHLPQPVPIPAGPVPMFLGPLWPPLQESGCRLDPGSQAQEHVSSQEARTSWCSLPRRARAEGGLSSLDLGPWATSDARAVYPEGSAWPDCPVTHGQGLRDVRRPILRGHSSPGKEQQPVTVMARTATSTALRPGHGALGSSPRADADAGFVAPVHFSLRSAGCLCLVRRE